MSSFGACPSQHPFSTSRQPDGGMDPEEGERTLDRPIPGASGEKGPYLMSSWVQKTQSGRWIARYRSPDGRTRSKT